MDCRQPFSERFRGAAGRICNGIVLSACGRHLRDEWRGGNIAGSFSENINLPTELRVVYFTVQMAGDYC